MIKKKIIYGCDSRGDADSPYLTRWTLLSCKLFAVYLHQFHRSDSPEHHDHPWAFASLILWRGYFEETPCKCCDGTGLVAHPRGVGHFRCPVCKIWGTRHKRVWPGMILFRRATHRHRVVLVDEKPAWTLVVRGPYVRMWGFFTSQGWQDFKSYFKERGC